MRHVMSSLVIDEKHALALARALDVGRHAAALGRALARRLVAWECDKNTTTRRARVTG